jgi:signal transduction histidine kinase/DNA-binding NarL/FixJ family response regulator/ABC-type nitrate/sulfonate/bicarbonate transport system substrate-binding protein
MLRHLLSSFHSVLIGQTLILLLFVAIPSICYTPGQLPLKVGIYDNPPFVFMDDKGIPRGFDIEMLNDVAAQEGWALEYIFDEWPVLMDQTRMGEIDLLMGIAYTEERDKFLDFGDVEFFSTWGAVSALSKSNIQDVADLDGEVIAVLKNDKIAEDFKQHCLRVGITPRFLEVDTYAEAFKLIESGEVLAGVSSNIYALRHAKHFNAQMVPVEFAPTLSTLAFPVGRHKEISKTISNRVWRLKRDKSSIYYRLYDRWFSSETLIGLTHDEHIWIKKHPVIRVALMSENPPYYFFDSSGLFSGLAADFFELFQKDLGIHIEVVTGANQKEILDMLANKEIDVIPTLNPLPEHEENMMFSDDFLRSSYAIVGRRGDSSIQNESDLAGKKLVLLKNFAANSALFKRHPDLNYSFAETPFEALNQISEGKADATVFLHAASVDLINRNKIYDLEIKTVLPWGGSKGSIGVRKDWPEFVSILNKELKATPENKKTNIFNKWVYPERRTLDIKRLVLTKKEKAWLRKHQEITLGFTPNIEPLIVVAEDGRLSGILVDIYDELEKLTGLKVKIKIDNWPSTVDKAKQGMIDGLLASPPSLANSIDMPYSTAIVKGTPAIFARTDAPFEINKEEDLVGKRIAVIKGIDIIEKTLARHKDKIEIIETGSAQEMMTLVLRGKADIAFGLSYHNYLIGKHFLVDIEPVYFLKQYSAVGVASISSESSEVVSIMNKALAAIGQAKVNATVNTWTQLQKEQEITPLVLTPEDRLWLEDFPSLAQLAFRLRAQVQLSAKEQKWLSTRPRVPIQVGDYPPFHFTADDTPQGISIDYMRVMCITHDLECDFVEGLTTDEAIYSMQNPGGIAIQPGWQRNAEREQIANFTGSYVASPFVIFQRQHSERTLYMEDLAGKRVVVEKNYAIHKLLKTNFPQLQLLETDFTTDAIKQLAAGQADAYVSNLMSGHYLSLDLGLPNIIVAAPAPFKPNSLEIAVRKDWPELASIIDKTIITMTQGEHKNIHNRWLSVDYQQKTDYSLVWKTALGFLIILTVVLAWVQSIRRQTAALSESEARLRKARDAANAANRAKSTFLANMSHELRTPLNAILGFSEMLGRDVEITGAKKEKLAIINNSGEHLLEMINDVLDLSKIEAGRVELEQQAFELPQMLQDIGQGFEARAENAGLHFKLELDPSLARYITSDVSKLRQILFNLLGNAVKFTTEGGFSLSVQTKPMQSDYSMVTLQLEVEDSGPGIAAEQLKRIFEPFIQAKRAKTNIKGTGLGLSICESFVKLLGGQISAESEIGKGSLFRITLPVALAEAAEVDGIETMRPPDVLGLELGQPVWRILVVEDSAESRLLLSSILQHAGFDVKEAENGEEAVALFQQWQPHFIWMDMRMPVMDGYEATAKIRELPGGDAVKIVAITASAFKEQRKHILEAGCDDVVHKPVQTRDIFDSMAQHLRVRYIYEKNKKPLLAETAVTLTGEMMAKVPAELKQALRQPTQYLDTLATNQVIELIRSDQPEIADGLQYLVEEFSFDQIMKLLDDDGKSDTSSDLRKTHHG